MIYIVEDDTSIAEVEIYALRNAGYEAIAFEDSTAFWQALQNQAPALVILDWMLPGESGIDILRRLREKEQTRLLPVLLVTAKDTELDIVKGLDAGADDFLTKPFGIMEFTSRVRALLRRAGQPAAGSDILRFGEITLNPSTHVVTAMGGIVELTFKEYCLLELLLQNEGRVVNRERIWARVWNADSEVESRTLDMHIRTLRQKLGPAGAYIQTIRKVGYKLEQIENEIH